MRTRTLGGLLLAMGLVAGGAAAQSAPSTYLFLQPESRIWVEGTSTVRAFTCTAAAVEATVQTATPGAAAALLAGEKAVRAVEVRVPAKKLDCANGTMNAHMLKALKADEHGTIRFRLSGYELGAPTATGIPVRLSGTLALGGAERPVTMQATAREATDGTLTVTGSQPVRMSEHGLKAPTLMLGTLKVGDQVTVRYELTLRP